MEQLKRQVAQARRRLTLSYFFGVLTWSMFTAMIAALVAIGIQKAFLVEIDGRLWAAGWLFGGAMAGLVAAAIWTWFAARRDLDAAIELDHRFGLKERVSSALALEQDELNSPSGQALVDDAIGRVSHLQVAERFPVELGRRTWLPLVPAAIAFALCFLADPSRSGEAGATPDVAAIAKQIKDSTEPLRRKSEERRKLAEEKGLKEAGDLFQKIEEGAREFAKKDETDRREALTKLNDLGKELEDRREKLSQGDKLKQQLAQMKSLPAGPADKLAQSMKSGDFEKALKELEKLKEQVAAGHLDPEKQKELAEQLKAMQDALQKMADAHKKAMDELQQKLDQAKKSGDQQTAKQLQEQLRKLAQQQPQMDRLQNLASQLGNASSAMREGKTAQAQAALQQMSSELSQLQEEAQEIEMLEVTLDELGDAKAAMMCDGCDGGGCQNCNKRGGNGLGGGEAGFGPRPENPHDTKFYDSKVKQNIGKGAAVVTGLVDGPNAKGTVLEDIKTQVEAASREDSDPLTGQRLPRSQRDHVQQYFDAFRQGQ